MRCPHCGKRVAAGARICQHCNARLPRPKKGSRREEPRRARLSPGILLMAGFGTLVMLAALVLAMPFSRGVREEQIPLIRSGREIHIDGGKTEREIAPHAVYGTVVAAHIGETRRGTIVVTSLHTAQAYPFSAGWYTSYHPPRYPFLGEEVTVHYRCEDGLLKATQVEMKQ
jgi:hypothetical protein